ncbi:hypothetical protein [Lapidilactobacillus bayanensis]|uniref:hypothetical protein n=1 Tax=Lapidilactobacillus bayanensis TaxID=2485998 RepID=UPI000F775C6F|nr:hypothetical protein [Lapidilactobacillus bayanensis]
MKRERYLLSVLIVGLFILTGCKKTINTKTELKENAQTVITQLETQKKQLTVIEDTYNQLQQQMPAAQKKNPGTNLLDDQDSKVYQLNQKAQDATDKVAASQKIIEKINQRLKDTATEKLDNLPNSAILKLTQSLHIVQLDHESFNKFITAYKKDQTDLYRNAPELLDEHAEELDELVSQNTQYLGAVNQQLEILQVNINSSLSSAQNLLANLN